MSEIVLNFQRFSMWPVAVLASVVLLVVWWTYRRTRPPLPTGYKILLVTLRSLVVVLLGMLALEPLLSLGSGRSRPERVALLVDRSVSMLLPQAGSPGGPSRLETARSLVGQWRSGRDVAAIYTFGRGLNRLEDIDSLAAESLEDRTDLADALEELLSAPGPGWDRVVLVSDGRVNAGGGVLAALPDSGVAIDVVPLGGSPDGSDPALSGIEQIAPAYEDGPVELELTLSGKARATLAVDIFLDGRKVAERRLRPPSGGASLSAERISFDAPAAGSYWLEASLRPLAGEFSELNNRRLLRLHVRQSRRTFLLISNSPDWDLTFTGRALAAVDDWEVSTLLILEGENGSTLYRRIRQGTFSAGSLPATAELDDAALVLLHGDIAKLGRRFLGRLAQRAAAGALGLVLWPTVRFDPAVLPPELAGVLPVSSGAIIPLEAPATACRLYTNGRYGVLGALGGGGVIDDLPPVTTVYRGLKPVRSAEILALAGSRGPTAGEGAPVLAVRPSAGVRSALITAQGLWRWHMQRQLGDPEDAALYFNMWRELAGWLTAAERRSPLVLEPGREVFGAGEPVSLSGEIRDALDDGEIVIEASLWTAGSAGVRDTLATVRTTRPAAAGERDGFALDFGVLPPGVYCYGALASSGADTLSAGGELAVEQFSPELAEARPDSLGLVALAASTGGRVISPGEAAEELQRAGEVREVVTLRISLSRESWIYWLIVALLAAEWTLRRQKALA